MNPWASIYTFRAMPNRPYWGFFGLTGTLTPLPNILFHILICLIVNLCFWHNFNEKERLPMETSHNESQLRDRKPDSKTHLVDEKFSIQTKTNTSCMNESKHRHLTVNFFKKQKKNWSELLVLNTIFWTNTNKKEYVDVFLYFIYLFNL